MYFELDNDVMESSKRRSIFTSLLFVLMHLTKPFISRKLQRHNQLRLCRPLEHLSFKQDQCDGAIEFLRLCENFGLTLTFAKIDETKCTKKVLKTVERVKYRL